MVFIWDLLQEDKIIYSSNSKILKKVESWSVILSKVADIFTGMQIIPEYFLSNDDSILNKSKWYKAVFSKNISRFSIAWPLEWQPWKYITYDNLLQDTIKKDLSERIKNGDNCRTPESLSIWSPDKEFRFFPPKLIMAQTISNANWKVKLQVAFDDYGYYWNVSIHLVKHEKETVLRSLLCILNSALITFYAKEKKFIMWAEEWSKKTPQIRKWDVELLPIPLNFLQKEGKFWDLSKIMMQLNNELHSMSESFLKNISAKYKIEKVTRKLEKWWELDFVDFIKELKVSIPLEEQEELMNYFEKRSMEVREIVSRIEATDKEIDEMVFELYGLNEEEKRIILESNGK